MDARVAAFDDAVEASFGFLIAEGFVAAPAEESGPLTRRPYSRIFTFRSSHSELDCALVLAFAGDDEIVTKMRSSSGARAEHRANAHKGHAVRKAVGEHAVRVQVELADRRG